MPYHYQNPKVLFQGSRVNVLSIETDYPKKGTKKELVDHPGAVVILPLLDPNTLLLIRNERPIVQRTLWELPAGTLEKNEDIEVCAARELCEETGYTTREITFLFNFFSTPGFCNERLYAFSAQNLEFVGQRLDATESIEVVPTKIDKVLEMIRQKEICDAKTIATFFYFLLQKSIPRL